MSKSLEKDLAYISVLDQISEALLSAPSFVLQKKKSVRFGGGLNTSTYPAKVVGGKS